MARETDLMNLMNRIESLESRVRFLSRLESLAKGYRYVQTVLFESSDTFKKADYSWLRAIKVKVQGAGAGGNGSGAQKGGQGGGGGCYAEGFVLVASLLDEETVTVGAGGSYGTSYTDLGSDGGSSSFGTHVTAEGGKAGSTSYLDGGSGGEVGTGDLVISGSSGDSGHREGTWIHGGSGGGSALGGGGRGGYYSGAGRNGASGKKYGGGGGGGCGVTASYHGGTGADGVVVLELYV